MPLFAASSALRAAPPPVVNLSPPTITGSPVVGSTLTATAGSWSSKGPAPSLSYQWQDCDGSGLNCGPIAQATRTTYTVATGDVGHTIRVQVTAATKFVSVPASSAPSAVVTAPDTTPPTKPGNFVSTSSQQGSIATSWTDPDSSVAGYTVYLNTNTNKVTTTTATSYTFINLTCGTTYTLAVDAYDAAQNHSAQATLTTATAACSTGTAPANTGLPVVSGTAQVGSLLTTSNGTWSGTTPMTFAYSWYDCDATGTPSSCTQISTAAAGTYTPATTDLGHTIRARVTAKNTAGSASAMSAPTAAVKAAPTASGLHVSGNQLLDSGGRVVHLHGVDRSGTEYACVQGWGIFDGPSDDASVAAIRSWNANIVHIGLNEDCILGINGVPSQYAGSNYLNAVVNFVNLLHAHGMYAEVNIFWAAAGATKATGQPPILDADHGTAALQAMANAFKNDPNTILGVTEEPHNVGWACWLSGGSACSVGYTALGMQGALTAIRSTGATNVVEISGRDYANDLSQFLAYKPADPLGQIVAQGDFYGNNTCGTPTCFDQTVAPVAQQLPVIMGETGETYDDSSCGSTNTQAIFNWADAHGVGYLAWTWDTWGTCLSLISNYNGTPANSAYANYVRTHNLSLP